ncbi:hypothetical protein TNCV_889011 [Trichonephila clavipes]|nr:hypothetical protein TNCV_889011 [Trichonephila clavipes]
MIANSTHTKLGFPKWGVVLNVADCAIILRPVSARTVRPRLQQRGLSTERPLFRLPLTMSIERHDDSGASNNKDEYRTMA